MSGSFKYMYSYYQTFEKRIQTFSKWTGLPNARLMSRAGFFWTANGDHVICFACGIGVKNWNCECDPWEEHLRYKPKCPFLRVGHNAYKQEKKIASYRSFEERLKSFTMSWPGTQFQDPVQMANAGFYYLGNGDNVKCYCCNIQLRSWAPDDLPLKEHAKWKPDCAHVIERLQTGSKRKHDFKIAIKADENSPEIDTGMFTKSKMSVENKDLEVDGCVSVDDLGEGLSIRTETEGIVELEMETYSLHSSSESNSPLLNRLQKKTF
ncbi:putative inhibitor of apoptosis [Crassostrea virginica]